MRSSADKRPWYREIWPWLLMMPPALSVAGGVTMLVLATHTPTALVVDDYARIEELTNERFERDREALRLELTAELRFEPTAGHVELSLSGVRDFELPDALTLILRHATNPAHDLELRLARNGSLFSIETELAPGQYTVEVMPDDGRWRLGSGTRRLDGRIALSPQVDGV
jgi:hypothetical protein